MCLSTGLFKMLFAQPAFTPLCRLLYCTMLLHPLVQLAEAASMRNSPSLDVPELVSDKEEHAFIELRYLKNKILLSNEYQLTCIIKSFVNGLSVFKFITCLVCCCWCFVLVYVYLFVTCTCRSGWLQEMFPYLLSWRGYSTCWLKLLAGHSYSYYFLGRDQLRHLKK